MKKNKFTFLFVFAFLGVFLFTCNENTDTQDLTVVKGFNYYPIEVGKYITYQLDSIIYGRPPLCEYPFIRDTFSHQLKEEVVDTFEDNTGTLNFIVERYLRKDESEPWVVVDVWNTKMSDTQVERVEENLRFIKLVFPVSDNVSWNGNAFFQDTSVVVGAEVIDFYQHWSAEYEYENIDQPEEINGITFDSVMTVVQSAASENLVAHRSSIEKYARGVGLVYKEMLILDSSCCIDANGGLTACIDLPWELKGEKGLILRQKVIDFN